ncbi:zinc C6HC-type [Fusarium heterosporum]|uniref:Zinc C6HC-type n=1 Tax=Fusarium heterosporum TaxID=42747 RepID=A0A8H5WL83_FUSHE|nr:zinc C6HC-type [Fusarium heterosporum]
MDDSSDYALALSIAQAVETDGDLIAALLQEEEQAARDHAWAQRLVDDPRAVADAGGNAFTNHINEEELQVLRHFNVAEADTEVPEDGETAEGLLPSPIPQASPGVETTDTPDVEALAIPEAGSPAITATVIAVDEVSDGETLAGRDAGSPSTAATTAATEADETPGLEGLATLEDGSPAIDATGTDADVTSDVEALAIPEAGPPVVTATTTNIEGSSDIEGLEALTTPGAASTDITATATELDATSDVEAFVAPEAGFPTIIAPATATEVSAIPELDVSEAAPNDSTAGPSDTKKECISCSDDVPMSELFIFTSCCHSICHPCLAARLQATLRGESLFPFQCCNHEIAIEQGCHISDEIY